MLLSEKLHKICTCHYITFPHMPQKPSLYISFGNTSLDQPAQSLILAHTHKTLETL